METKINIAEILKNCPKNMELYSPLCGKCVFDHINMGTIICKKQNNQDIAFTSRGYYVLPVCDDCECMIFPSKDQRDWSKFQIPFKEGDILISNRGDIHISRDFSSSYCCLRRNRFDGTITTAVKFDRLATEEEKLRLFAAIKANGYKWNAEIKTLEELKKDKFDITTLKSFESKVLVRDTYSQPWKSALYGFKDFCLYAVVGGNSYCQCIPYKGNEHLLGTTNDCNDFYETWK